MDIIKHLKSVTTLNEYISFTLELQNTRIQNLKVPFNISTILSLKNIRSIEIEYFNKYEENGAAMKIFELLLRSPTSKTWNLLGVDLVSLLQYWLEAVRKHLIIHNVHWWTFLKGILNFISGINCKDISINKLLIEETADCLLYLATHTVPDVKQRLEIIQVFNCISAESSRNIRLAFKDKFRHYFVKLAALLASCGDCPLQHRALEALMRWLLPRRELAARRAAAAEWFPQGTYAEEAVRVFLDRPWQNFVQDARAFLNAQNSSGELVTSVVCKRISVGGRDCNSSKDNKSCWVDLNYCSRSLSVQLDPQLGAALGSAAHDWLVVDEQNTSSVELMRDSQHALIKLSVLALAPVYPFPRDVIGDSPIPTVSIGLSSRTDLRRLDAALRRVFGDKYLTTLDLENPAYCISPHMEESNSDVINGTEEELRFFMPSKIRRRRHLGVIVRNRNTGSLNSPSTASTSSLAQLQEKLAALPRYTFDKESVSVCALPQLSTVSEVTETEENHSRNSSLSTIKHRTYGVRQKKCTRSSNRTSGTDNETSNLSPVQNDNESSVSCLLMATLGSADESIISDIIDRLPENIPCNTDNIVDLLAKEALQQIVDIDSGVNIADHRKSPNIQPENKQQLIDESSNEVVENTPLNNAQFKRSNRKTVEDIQKSNDRYIKTDGNYITHDVEAVENFFSQHFTENRNGDLVISPTLARKINETSSECSEDVELYIAPSKNIIQVIEFDQLFTPDVDIVECVSAMVNKVCQDLDKCMDLIDNINEAENNTKARSTHKKKTTPKKNTKKPDSIKIDPPKQKAKPSKTLKLKFTNRKSLSLKTTLKKSQPNKVQPFQIMSPIIERDSVADDTITKSVDNLMESPKRTTTPTLRRKRKLYSPKDETSHEKTNVPIIDATDDYTTTNLDLKACSTNRKSIATSYKELEKERKNRIRRPRTRLLKKTEILSSPRTLRKNQIFDSLKDVIHGEPVQLVDKTSLNKDSAVFNFTSDSEEEQVNKRKSINRASKKVPSPVAGNAKTTTKTTRSRKKAATKTGETSNGEKVEGVKRTRNLRTKKMVKKGQKENVPEISNITPDLQDERMRGEASDFLNTSLVIEGSKVAEKFLDKQPVPVLNVVPQMECIVEVNKFDANNGQSIKNSQQKSKTKRMLSLKRNKEPPKSGLDLSMADNERTVSPLPGLVVETVLTTQSDINDSVTTNMLQKFKDIYEGKKALPETEVNTTHNLLSDTNEPERYSPSNLNVTEELNRTVDESVLKKKPRLQTIKKVVKKKGSTKSQNKKGDAEKVEPKSHNTKPRPKGKIEAKRLSVPEIDSERTMATMGNSHSPITGHGDFDEDPPDPALLNQNIQPRIVEQEYLDQSLQNFFSKLTEKINDTSLKDRVQSNSGHKDENKKSSARSSVKSTGSNSPVVLLTRLSPEYFNPTSNSRCSLNASKSKTRQSIVSSEKTSKENIKNKNRDRNSVEESDKTPKANPGIAKARRSVISPIKLFDDMNVKNVKTTSARSESDDDCLKHIRTIFSSKKQNTHTSSSQIEKMETRSTRIRRRNIATSSPISRDEPALVERRRTESNSSKASTSSIASKRKSSPVLRSSKRVKREEINNNFGSTLIDSGPSLSSVHEWFRRNEPTRRGDLKSTINDYLNNVLEKLDTTLVEIHHNSSKRFIDMFVDAGGRLAAARARRERLYRETAAGVLTAVVRTMELHFVELNDRLQSMDEEFMENLKKRAHELVREECKQKQVMVTMLRDDVKAAAEHLRRQHDSEE